MERALYKGLERTGRGVFCIDRFHGGGREKRLSALNDCAEKDEGDRKKMWRAARFIKRNEAESLGEGFDDSRIVN